MTEMFRRMYTDVAYKVTPTKADVSFLRSKVNLCFLTI